MFSGRTSAFFKNDLAIRYYSNKMTHNHVIRLFGLELQVYLSAIEKFLVIILNINN